MGSDAGPDDADGADLDVAPSDAPADAALSEAGYRALADFRYQIRRFSHFSEEAARAAGVEPQHHQLLLAVRGRPDGEPASVGAIAERLQLQPHSALELVDRLVDRGLVARQRDPADRRRVLVALTPQGEDVLHRLSLHHVEELRRAGPDLVRALRAAINAGQK